MCLTCITRLVTRLYIVYILTDWACAYGLYIVYYLLLLKTSAILKILQENCQFYAVRQL